MGAFRNIDAGDVATVRAMLCAAFDTEDEADLVEALRASGDMEYEWVLDGPEGPVAYAALSRMRAPEGWLCLAPVAVWPAAQGQGHGLRLMQKIVHWASAAPDARRIVVLGSVPFYEKAGFSNARAARLETPYPVAHTLYLGPGNDCPSARLVYPAAFDDLD